MLIKLQMGNENVMHIHNGILFIFHCKMKTSGKWMDLKILLY